MPRKDEYTGLYTCLITSIEVKRGMYDAMFIFPLSTIKEKSQVLQSVCAISFFLWICTSS